jgi:uncharacterized protein
MYADEKDLRGLYAITLAAFLLLSLKLGALVQYFQQTHHVFLNVNPGAASADWFHLTDEIETARVTLESIQSHANQRLITAGQIIVLGDDAIPEPEIPVCPVVAPQVIEHKCPQLENLNPDKSSIAKADSPQETIAVNPEIKPQDIIQTAATMADPDLTELPDTDTPIELKAGDKVLLVGDSMMQGLGPHLVSSLSRNNGVQTVDLSRHSTGLAYPHYYDWPNTILQKLQSDKFKLMMIFIGANDTWDIVINGRYTSFGNPKWVEVYSERVEKIILTAKAYNVRVLWLGAPPMGREKMTDRVPVLNQIFESAAAKYPGVARYLPTANSITSDGKTFSKFIEVPSRGKVMVRTDDGVHFTSNGQRLLAQLALSQLVLHPYNKKLAAVANPYLSSSSAVSATDSSNSLASSSVSSTVSSITQISKSSKPTSFATGSSAASVTPKNESKIESIQAFKSVSSATIQENKE